MMPLRSRLLFGVVVVLEGPEDFDLLPRRARLDRLGAALQQVEGLAGLL